jgi:threonylcarbamoyladenosine tRNA methylthiotransferase MtaB
MARRTTGKEFAALVDAARGIVPDISISTDVIVGFPGETDDEFEESRGFVEEMAFSRLHIFRYSRREGTPAATMPNQVRGPVSSERSRRFHELGADLERRFNSRFVGRRTEVLWETAEDLGTNLRWSGLTPNYIRVSTETDSGTDLLNTITPTDLVEAVPGGLIGRITNSEFGIRNSELPPAHPADP